MPAFKAPSFDIPKAPSFDSAPKISAPSFSSDFSIPKASLPKFDSQPSSSSYSAPARPSFEIPKDTDKYKDRPELQVSQEDRDANAKSANDVFKQYDQEARVAEKAAQDARGVANKQKKEKSRTKDLACETKPGGKLLCLRGFGAGF